MSDPLMSIGTFSRAASLSIKTLRAYHAQGLLTPAAVDPETGFRRYAAGQLADAAVIRRLRELEVPLADVATILTARDPEVTAATLARHAEQEVTAYFPVDADVAPASTTLLHLPSVTAAVVTHAGDHETLPDTYGLLGAWVAHHGTPTGQPLREAYVVNVSDGVPPSAYQTDIVWPLIPRKDTP